MASIQILAEEIIEELRRSQNLSPSEIASDPLFPIPGLIATGNGGAIMVSRKIDKNIALIARQLISNNALLAQTFTDAEWRATVRRAFGPSLILIDPNQDLSKGAAIVLENVQRLLAETTKSNTSKEYVFGCTLLANKDIASFQIGPVLFEPRLVWLNRKASTGEISQITQRRIIRCWKGKKLNKRKASYESIKEKNIVDAIDSCPYVCSVLTQGLAAEAGQQKALIAARLALCAIALLWETSSKALEGFNLVFDRSLHRQETLIFIPGRNVLGGSKLSHLPHGPSLKPGEWESLLVAWSTHFSVVGDILEYILNPIGNVTRPRMMNTLAQSLLWFHEACRESVSLMAIVKFTASMDALAGGRKSPGIRRVINARLGIKDAATIRPNGPTLKNAIDQIYSEGRSRTIHGTNDRLGYDWTVTKGLAEYFARLCLVSCIDWAGQNPTSDDPLQLAK